MKKLSLLAALLFVFIAARPQVVATKTSNNVSAGFDIFTDVFTKSPDGIKMRAINQGFGFSTTYNFKVGETKHIFALGAGLRMHNFYSNGIISDVKADTIVMSPINKDLNYKRSKLGLTYIDIPAEFRLKFKDNWKIGIGFKMGIALDSKTKYRGQTVKDGPYRLIKEKRINALEKYTFGPTLRVGYKWVNLYAYYQPSRIFQRDLGPEIYPFSLGITITPY